MFFSSFSLLFSCCSFRLSFNILLLPLLFLFYQSVLGAGEEFRINTAEGLVNFSKIVNSGTNYSGTTVFLDADIDFSGGFSEQFEPIGKDYYNSFQGTFDGQGHTISNLAINSSSSSYAGLFGYSRDATIRNVVLDSSCSVVSSFSGSSSAFVGGIIGGYYAFNGLCVIESNVNMASVAFTGSTSWSLFLCGIVGYPSAKSNDVTVRNCANYGSVTHSGNITNTMHSAYIGGIAGYSWGSSSNKVFIQNSLNYGTVSHNGTTTGSLYIGGILGYSASGTNSIENCVSGGKTTSNKASNYYIGSVVGQVRPSTTTITHCYWSSDVGNYNVCGDGSPAVDTETSLVSLNTTTVDNLNSYNSSWDKWLLNTNNKTVTFNINNGKGFSLSSQLILLPSLAESESHTFSGWFEYEDCTKELINISVEAEIALYGGWKYIVTFDPAGGVTATSSKSVVYGQKYGTLPDATKTGYTFVGWFTEKEEGKGEKVTENDTVKNIFDHTLYAHWTINSYYTIIFDFGNGTVVSTTLKYDDTINYPENPTREGYAFNGWDPKPERMPANDTTVVAQWTIINYTITFDFGNGTVANESLTYNEPIIYPVSLTREGYVFNEWDPKPERMPADDTTVVAQWIENVTPEVESEYVEIVFDRKDMTEEEVKEIIKNITQDENIYIERIETDKGTGETTVIIRFTDTEKAKGFVRAVSEGKAPSTIKKVTTVLPEHNSFTLKIDAMTMTPLLILFFMCVVRV